MLMQMNIMVRVARHRQPQAPVPDVAVPRVSLEHLIRMFLNQRKINRHYTKLLTKIHNDGVVAEEHFVDGRVAKGAVRYRIHWCLGKTAADFDTSREFEDWIRYAILHYGGVLIDIKMGKKFDYYGNDIYRGPEGEAEVTLVRVTDGVKRDLGHGGVVFKWETLDDNTSLFTFLNSYGPQWGVAARHGDHNRGCGRLTVNAIHHVYVPQVLKWF